MNLFDLTGKRAIVTGGTHGQLGPVWMQTLGDAGALPISLDLPFFDVTKTSLTLSEPIDILINNAAIDNPPGSGATFFGNFDEIMRVNIGGAVRMTETVIPQMIKNGGGVIINIGSIQGYIGADYRNYEGDFEKPVGYNCSKASLAQLTRSIAVQYGRYNIRSVCIAFGTVQTGKLTAEFLAKFLRQVPLNRPVTPDSLRTTLLYACCCPELTGQTILVDGGYTAW